MKIKNINKTIYEKNYHTDNIIEVVLYAYEVDNDQQIKDLANKLKGVDDWQTARNIWDYLLSNITYIADVSDQDIKTPARLIHDGTGDCKSYSVFTAVILRELGIKHFFRFVSYSKKKVATHVYVVAIIDGQEVPIDAVATVQKNANFGTELIYNYRADMSKIGRIRYLAGVGDKAAIGNSAEDIQNYLQSDAFKAWTGDDAEADLTRAKGYLFALWDRYWIAAKYANNEQERIEALNYIQYVAIMIRASYEFAYSDEMLERAGRTIGFMIDENILDNNRNVSEREFFTEENYTAFLNYLNNSDNLPVTDFYYTWQNEVVGQNYTYTDDNGSAIGAVEINELRTNLKQTGGYYIYALGVSNSEAMQYSIDSPLRKKKVIQEMLLNKTISLNNRMNSSETELWIQNGLCETWQSSNPQKAFESLKNQSINGAKIGEITTTAVLAIITTIVGIIGTIIGWFKKDEIPSSAIVNSGMFNPSDLSNLNKGNSSFNTAGSSLLLPLGLVGAYFFSKKIKNKKSK